MFGGLDIPTSGMIAQRTRLDVISSNIANASTVLDSEGKVNPFRRRMAMLAPGDPSSLSGPGRSMGVHVANVELDDAPFQLRWDPSSPYAYKDGPNRGYVPTPNVNSAIEQIDALEATRAYEANVAVAEAFKAMTAQALRLLA